MCFSDAALVHVAYPTVCIMRCTYLDLGFMGDRHITILSGHNDFENPKLILLHRMVLPVPVV